MAKTVVRPQGHGDAYWVLGGLYEVLASSEDSGGAVTIMQMTVPAESGAAAPHAPGSESVYVIEGTVTASMSTARHTKRDRHLLPLPCWKAGDV